MRIERPNAGHERLGKLERISGLVDRLLVLCKMRSDRQSLRQEIDESRKQKRAKRRRKRRMRARRRLDEQYANTVSLQSKSRENTENNERAEQKSYSTFESVKSDEDAENAKKEEEQKKTEEIVSLAYSSNMVPTDVEISIVTPKLLIIRAADGIRTQRILIDPLHQTRESILILIDDAIRTLDNAGPTHTTISGTKSTTVPTVSYAAPSITPAPVTTTPVSPPPPIHVRTSPGTVPSPAPTPKPTPPAPTLSPLQRIKEDGKITEAESKRILRDTAMKQELLGLDETEQDSILLLIIQGDSTGNLKTKLGQASLFWNAPFGGHQKVLDGLKAEGLTPEEGKAIILSYRRLNTAGKL